MVDICLSACITCCGEICKEVNDRCGNPCGDNNDKSGGRQKKHTPNTMRSAATRSAATVKINVMSGTDMSRKLEF